MGKVLKIHVFLMAATLLLLTACTPKKSAVYSGDIITQKAGSPEKIAVTILVKNAFSIHEFERIAEEHFPTLDIIQVSNYTSDMGIAEYEKRLENSDITDIVMTWPLEVGEQYWQNELLDLSAMPYTSGYNIAFLNKISKDGKLYYLPGPSQVRGIVYNKTLFKENGWAVPKDYDGFVSLCKKIEKSGIRALQLGFADSEVLDTAFVGYGIADCFSTPKNSQTLMDYNAGKGSFGDSFTPALNTFQELIEAGIFQKSDLGVDYAAREEMIFNRKCAMVEDSVSLCRKGMAYNGCTDEFGLMPFFNPGVDNDWARIYPVCYIGLNKQLAEKKNKEKYELVTKLMEYISTPEGQTALAADTGAMISSLSGTEPPDIPEIEDLLPALTHGRYATFPTLKNAQSALRKGLAGMLAGKQTAEDVIRQVDAENANPPIEAPEPTIGTSSANFTMIETGNFLTDAMRKESGCEIALFLDNGKDGLYNGKGVDAKLYKGSITEIDLRRILPDLKMGEKGVLWKVTMTGENLIKTLEYSISVNNGATGWFYYFSGFKMEFNPCAEPGSRIIKISDENGAAIDPKRIYSVAIADESVPPEVMIDCQKTEKLILDIFADAIIQAETISPSGDGRFTICQP